MTGSGHPTPRVVLFVPVHNGNLGPVIRLFHTPMGAPTAVGFTTANQLTDVLGDTQQWIRLAEPALRAMVGPLGVAQLVIDPTLAARAAAPTTHTPAAAPTTTAVITHRAPAEGQPA
ncbi:SAV_915 family protein [Rhodococcus sp. X156]|uniref:SAV_915 family protein n=1 Tax=Rhodococcus sp. X156 TaxID=2499145 RepID=UPI000FD811BD|nr:SAV_915 family protein [Rhodococcus sp. X156]